jgi:Ca2+-binding EF-hand superfamily protein
MPPADDERGRPDRAFDRVDKNADGFVEIEEFAVLMLEMDRRCSSTDMRACFDAIDSDRDGRITRREFREWVLAGFRVDEGPGPGSERTR